MFIQLWKWSDAWPPNQLSAVQNPETTTVWSGLRCCYSHYHNMEPILSWQLRSQFRFTHWASMVPLEHWQYKIYYKSKKQEKQIYWPLTLSHGPSRIHNDVLKRIVSDNDTTRCPCMGVHRYWFRQSAMQISTVYQFYPGIILLSL